jgi:hypothetical protein
LLPLLTGNDDGHIHWCDHCTLPYWHKHKLGHKHTNDRQSSHAKHPQFKFDCPYSQCDNYNHVDCSTECKLPGHAAATTDLAKRAQTAFRLSPAALAKFATDVNKLIDNQITAIVPANNGSTAVIPYDTAKLKQLVEAVPVKTTISGPQPYQPNMGASMNIIPDGAHYDLNPISKTNTVYSHVSGNFGKFTTVSTGGNGFIEINTESDKYVLPAKLLNTCITIGAQKKDIAELNKYVERQVSGAMPGTLTPQMLLAAQMYVAENIISRSALIKGLQCSTTGDLLSEALNGGLVPYTGFWSTWWRGGFKRAVKLWWSTKYGGKHSISDLGLGYGWFAGH